LQIANAKQRLLSVTPDHNQNLTDYTQARQTAIKTRWDLLSVTTSVTQSEIFLYTVYTTPSMMQVVPQNNVYDYVEYVVYTSPTELVNSASGTPKAEVTTISDALSLRSIPGKIYLGVRRLEADRTGTWGMYMPDVYRTITGVKISFGNRANLLASATGPLLFQWSKENGLEDRWVDWEYGCGSVLCLKFGSNIELTDPSEAPGVSGSYRLQIEVSHTWNRGIKDGLADYTDMTWHPYHVDAKYELFVITETDGIFQIFDETSTVQIGVVTPKQVMEAREKGEISSEMVEDMPRGGLGGGNLVKKIVSGTTRAITNSLAANQGYNQNVMNNVADGVDGFMNSFGSGGQRLVGRGTKRGREEPRGSYQGAATMTASDLRQLANQGFY
jgi:hypothetical protein